MGLNLPAPVNRYAVDDAAVISLDSFGYRFGYEFAVPHCQARESLCCASCSWRRWAGEADAILAGDAGAPRKAEMLISNGTGLCPTQCYPSSRNSLGFGGTVEFG